MDYSGSAVATCANKHSFGKLLLHNDFNICKDVNSVDTGLCCSTTLVCTMLPYNDVYTGLCCHTMSFVQCCMLRGLYCHAMSFVQCCMLTGLCCHTVSFVQCCMLTGLCCHTVLFVQCCMVTGLWCHRVLVCSMFHVSLRYTIPIQYKVYEHTNKPGSLYARCSFTYFPRKKKH